MEKKKKLAVKLEKRMYFLVMYNLSPIQQGIQAGHASDEYKLKYGKDAEYLDFLKNWKTWIVLNGGTSNDGITGKYQNRYFGSMELHYKELMKNKIKCAKFHEPDLNNSLSAIAFLVDERVFNREDYPDLINYLHINGYITNSDVYKYRNETTADFLHNQIGSFKLKEAKAIYNDWLNLIGGKQNEFLKYYLKPLKLA